MNRLLLAVALTGVTGLMVGTAAAQTATEAPTSGTTDPAGLFRSQPDPLELLASDLIGMRVFASPSPDGMASAAGIASDWEDIGEIDDLVLTREGDVAAVLVDVGGFLGIAERQIAVDIAALRFVGDDATTDNPADFFLVLGADRALLESAPGYGAPMADGATATGAEPGATPAPDAMAGPAGTLPEGETVYPAAELTAERLTGAAVSDLSGNRMGEVTDLVIDEGGGISHVVMDIGGFLGIGEKRVALPLEEVQVTRTADGGAIRVYVPYGEDHLKAMETYQY